MAHSLRSQGRLYDQLSDLKSINAKLIGERVMLARSFGCETAIKNE